MHQTKKGNNWYFGMKAHIGVDAESGLINTVASEIAWRFSYLPSQWQMKGVAASNLSLLRYILINSHKNLDWVETVTEC